MEPQVRFYTVCVVVFFALVCLCNNTGAADGGSVRVLVCTLGFRLPLSIRG